MGRGAQARQSAGGRVGAKMDCRKRVVSFNQKPALTSAGWCCHSLGQPFRQTEKACARMGPQAHRGRLITGLSPEEIFSAQTVYDS